MADKISYNITSLLPGNRMGQAVDEMMRAARDSRRIFERKWYDNNFFDDGYHFRYLSRQQNKIIDIAERQNIFTPMRAIPLASKSVRGMVNLLVSQDWTPVIYPEKVSKIAFPNPQEYREAVDEAKKVARSSGHWVEEEMDEQDIFLKLALMAILAAKNNISYLQVWPDPIKEEISVSVLDAFDLFLLGKYTELSEVPFIIKATPKLISEIKANENFDEEAKKEINPDNRLASSEIKEAYMRARHNQISNPDSVATVILKEAFVKEFVGSNNRDRIRMQENGGDLLKKFKDGDSIIRQTFVAGNITLRDEYLDLPEYPFIDFRWEPGPLYQTSPIERLIPLNKSYDLVMSRIERYTHTMVAGSWSVKRSEGDPQIDNTAGGQIFKYDTTPPVQNQVAPLPGFIFNFLQIIHNLMDEQAPTQATSGKTAPGIKANAAIESLKESEYATLIVATKMMKNTVKRVAQTFLNYADNYFTTPKTVYYLEKGEPQYFDIIGKSALEARKKTKMEGAVPDGIVPISKESKVDIEIQQGSAYTREGQKQAAVQLAGIMNEYTQTGFMPPEAMKIFIQQLLEQFKFGPTQDIMEAIETYGAQGNMTADQLAMMKTAFMEVMNDLHKEGVLPTAEQRIQETQVGVLQAVKDTGGTVPKQPAKPISESINYKDAPPDIRRQMEQQAGFTPSTQDDPSVVDQKIKVAQTLIAAQKGGESATNKNGK